MIGGPARCAALRKHAPSTAVSGTVVVARGRELTGQRPRPHAGPLRRGSGPTPARGMLHKRTISQGRDIYIYMYIYIYGRGTATVHMRQARTERAMAHVKPNQAIALRAACPMRSPPHDSRYWAGNNKENKRRPTRTFSPAAYRRKSKSRCMSAWVTVCAGTLSHSIHHEPRAHGRPTGKGRGRGPRAHRLLCRPACRWGAWAHERGARALSYHSHAHTHTRMHAHAAPARIAKHSEGTRHPERALLPADIAEKQPNGRQLIT